MIRKPKYCCPFCHRQPNMIITNDQLCYVRGRTESSPTREAPSPLQRYQHYTHACRRIIKRFISHCTSSKEWETLTVETDFIIGTAVRISHANGKGTKGIGVPITQQTSSNQLHILTVQTQSHSPPCSSPESLSQSIHDQPTSQLHHTNLVLPQKLSPQLGRYHEH